MGAPTEQGHGQEPRRILAQFAAVLRELPAAIPGMLTPGWVVELTAKEERCRQHGAAVGLRPEQVDEVMTAMKQYPFVVSEDILKERLTSYALGQDWRLP
jgi:hypothetical protein